MKEAVRKCAPLSRLLTDEEKAGLVTQEDKAAEKNYIRADRVGITDWIDGAGIFSATNSMCSWVVWALDEVRGTGVTASDL